MLCGSFDRWESKHNSRWKGYPLNPAHKCLIPVEIDVTKFRHIAKSFPQLLYPMFLFQSNLAAHVMGKDFWSRQKLRFVQARNALKDSAEAWAQREREDTTSILTTFMDQPAGRSITGGVSGPGDEDGALGVIGDHSSNKRGKDLLRSGYKEFEGRSAAAAAAARALKAAADRRQQKRDDAIANLGEKKLTFAEAMRVKAREDLKRELAMKKAEERAERRRKREKGKRHMKKQREAQEKKHRARVKADEEARTKLKAEAKVRRARAAAFGEVNPDYDETASVGSTGALSDLETETRGIRTAKVVQEEKLRKRRGLRRAKYRQLQKHKTQQQRAQRKQKDKAKRELNKLRAKFGAGGEGDEEEVRRKIREDRQARERKEYLAQQREAQYR